MWRNPKVWISVLSLAGVFYIFFGDIFRSAPGPLSAVHGRDPKLAGINSCSQCHGGLFGSMTDACLRCHEPIGRQIDSGEGLHGSLGQAKAAQCAPCHSEHHGADFSMVNAQTFAQARVPDVSKFDHAIVGYEMSGKHLEQECSDCHENADVEVLPEGGQRFMGLDQACQTCHEDAHEGRMQLQCAQCHGQEAFDQLDALGHERHLPLIGGHADVSCRTCHAEEEAHSLEALGGGDAPAPRECADCHESPHAERFVRGVSKLVSMLPGRACVQCHKAEHESFVGEQVEVNHAQHATSGFPLNIPHDEVTCAECHDPDEERFAARYPGRAADECARCHEDPHGGQFDSGPFAEKGCVGCHERQHFEPHAFTVDLHARTSLALTGRHVETECNDCHEKPEDEPRVFRGAPGRCELCHDDAHLGFFARFKRELAKEELGECAACHTTVGFSEVDRNAFDHTAWTGFEVAGAHAQGDCALCHKPIEKPDRFGRVFGRVVVQFGKYTGCETCHQDPHEGRFDGEDRPQHLDGRTGCERCHVQSSFRTFPRGFEHGRWTDFALEGAHREASCAACHKPLRKPDKVGRTWGRARGSACADCHTDPHAGQFEVEGRVDCQRCHTTKTFRSLIFDHDVHSRFPLDKSHRNVACAGCHKPFLVGKKEVIRYRPLGTECVDCHGAPEKPFGGRRR